MPKNNTPTPMIKNITCWNLCVAIVPAVIFVETPRISFDILICHSRNRRDKTPMMPTVVKTKPKNMNITLGCMYILY